MPLLSVVIWLPIAVGVLLLALDDKRARLVRWLALVASLATFAASVPLYTRFDAASAAMQTSAARARLIPDSC